MPSRRRWRLQRDLRPLGRRRAKRGYPAARAALRPSLRSVLHLGLRPRRWTRRPPSLRAGLSLRESVSWVAALRLAPGASPPDNYRAAGAALRSGDAMPLRGSPAGRLRRRCPAPRCRLPPAPGRGPGGLAGACPQPRFAAPPKLPAIPRHPLKIAMMILWSSRLALSTAGEISTRLTGNRKFIHRLVFR